MSLKQNHSNLILAFKVMVDKETRSELLEKPQSTDTGSFKRITLPPLAWYGGSWAYEDTTPETPAEVVETTPAPPLEEAGKPPDFGPERGPGKGRGVILGRFMPPHAGHQYLVDFARAITPDLTLFLNVGDKPAIAGELRESWLKELFPTVKVVRVDSSSLLEDLENQEVVSNWAGLVKTHVAQPDYIFASDNSIAGLALRLGASAFSLDQQRRVFPVSSTQIRANPYAHWEYLPPCVKAFYTRRVCLIGPEGTGKSTLAWRLAARYNTLYTDEIARKFTASQGYRWRATDTQTIAVGQMAAETALARRANRVLFCDTDILAVWLWSERLFGAAPQWVREAANSVNRDLYLITKPDASYAQGAESERQTYYERCLQEIRARKLPFAEITGADWEARFSQACAAVDKLLTASPN